MWTGCDQGLGSLALGGEGRFTISVGVTMSDRLIDGERC